MLEITLSGGQFFNSQTNEIRQIKPVTLHFEHSLLAISKWESKYHKPFLGKEERSQQEMNYYVFCMCIENISPEILYNLSKENLEAINSYIADSMTATWFPKDVGKRKSRIRNSETITSELIYYWMVALTIPFEAERWNLNRLLTLIKICNLKNEPPKKYSRNDVLRQNSALNAARRSRLHSKG